jgi:glucokinase
VITVTALALTIDATTIAVGRVDPDGQVHDARRVPTPATSVWDTCRRLLLDAAGADEVASVGICSAGPIDMAAGIVAPADIAEWGSGFDIVAATRELFPTATPGLAVEGVCLALAEQRYGQADGVMDALAITVSSHITGGMTVGGFVLVGHTGNAGNIGHTVVAGYDDRCACGGRGCLEAIASAPSSIRWARTQGWTGTSPDDLVEAARSGEPIAAAALQRAGTALGQAISSAAALLDLDLVIVGGSFAQSGGPLWRPLSQAVATHSRLSFLAGLRVVPTTLDASATLNGVALLTMAAPQPA